MSLARRIANLFSRSRIHEDIDAELRSHIDMRTADNVANGMSPDAARTAMPSFVSGNPTAINERTTSADTALTLASIIGDVRFAFRQLARSPGFAWTSILTAPRSRASGHARRSSAPSSLSSSTRCPTLTLASL